MCKSSRSGTVPERSAEHAKQRSRTRAKVNACRHGQCVSCKCYDWAHVDVQGIMACKHLATARPPCLACTKPCVPCGTAFGQGCVGGAISVDGAAGESDLSRRSDEVPRSSGHEADCSTRCKTKHAVLVAFGQSLSLSLVLMPDRS